MRFDAGDLDAAPLDGEAEPLSFVMTLSTDRTPPIALHIGRLVDSQITVADPSVSEHHATLTLGADFSTAQLVDHHSTNGSYVNGSKLRPYLAVDVEPGDTLRFGRVRFRFLNAQAFAQLLFES